MTRVGPVLLVLFVPLVLGAAEDKPSTFTSKEGKFSVALPDKPDEKESKVKAGEGEVKMHAFSAGQKGRAYAVTYTDFPATAIGADKDAFLDGVVERTATSLKGKLVTDERITIGKKKHPGHIIRVELPNKKELYRARVFLVGDRLYQVIAFGPDEFAKSKAVDDYLNSFEIDE